MCSRAILRVFTVENAFFKKPKNSAFEPLFWRVFQNKWSRKRLVGQFWPKIYHWTRFHDNLRPRLVKIFPRSLSSALKEDPDESLGVPPFAADRAGVTRIESASAAAATNVKFPQTKEKPFY